MSAPNPKKTVPSHPTAVGEGAVVTSKASADWELVERHYRAGIMSLREIATDAGITEGAVRKRAKRDQWTRDLSAKIKARADDLVRKTEVRTASTQLTPVAERQVIEANAEAIVQVRLSHRRDVSRSRSIVIALLDEMEGACGTENAALLAELGELMHKPDKNGQDKLNDLYRKLMALPGRAKTMKDLSETLRVLVALERQAFGLDDKDNAPVDALTSLLHGIANANGNGFVPVAQDPEHDQSED